ncbi:MAG: acetyl-CoA carboxylase biotin carboxyl carrier protein subunit [Candidatus Aminicenantes bacterium]|nr:acetyl-CoA carboxylase biotin carboxyl carrier protein subunit [Candidatus Aminicenantes bacterium]
MEFEYLVDGVVRKISVVAENGLHILRDGEAELRAEILPLSEEELFLSTDGRSHRVFVLRDEDRTVVFHGGREYVLVHPRRADGAAYRGEEGGTEGGVVKAPMPGKVIKVLVAEGEAVRKNQTLLIVEAMKMENEIKAGRECSVRKVHVAVGDLVDASRTLIELE